MKRKLLFVITAIVMLFALGAIAAACTATPNDDPDKPNDNPGNAVEYSVTVKAPDGTPATGLTVSWTNAGKEYGKATTDVNGKATADLSPATYNVVISGQAEGIIAPSVSETSSMRTLTLTLSYAKVTYKATVIDKNGSPAANVAVTWSASSAAAGNAKTNAAGVAECELDYGEYTVTVTDLPADNVAPNDPPTATGSNPNVRFELIDGTTIRYTVTVRSEGGLKFANKRVTVRNAKGDLIALPDTDADGKCTFSAIPGSYSASVAVASPTDSETAAKSKLPTGYTVTAAILSANNTDGEIVAKSSIISALPSSNDFYYVMGDIFHDYEFTTPYNVNGAPITVKVSEILKTKKMLILNNWGTNCTFCVQEMPAMDEFYAAHKNDVEIVAVSNYYGGDSDYTITNYYMEEGYAFPMLRDTYGFTQKFNISAWPATVIIDRYGAIARIESGALTDVGLWERLYEMYCGDDYIQTFIPGAHESNSIRVEVTKPNVTVPDGHYDNIAATVNNTEQFPEGASVGWYGAPDNKEYEYAWPFLLGTADGVSDTNVLYPANTGTHNSYSVLFATVTAPAGSVFTFDYYAQTETDKDVMSFLWDGMIIEQISGMNTEWKTCKLYADITTSNHTLAITYMKDSSTHTGKDSVYIRNVRFTSLGEITSSTNMLRPAAYGVPELGASTFPYYASVSIDADDTYYHVNTSALQNASYAGNDESPLLFMNLNNATNWLGYSINTLVLATQNDKYVFDTMLTVNGVTKDYRDELIEYLAAATYSDIPDFVPVDKELRDLITAFMAKAKQQLASMNETPTPGATNTDTTLHENEWLELCYFYSHYGDGEPLGNPIIGLTTKTARHATVGTNSVTLYRYMSPFSAEMYAFTPTESAVYKITSLLPSNSKQATQIWVFDDNTDDDHPLAYSGSDRMTRTGENENNFEVYMYMEQGHTYYMTLAYLMNEMGTYQFSITNVGQSATALRPAADIEYTFAVDDNGNITSEIVLSNPVEYIKDDDGYYHAKNPDGTMGSYLYLDLVNPTVAMSPTKSVQQMLDMKMLDPRDASVKLDYTVFDFRYVIALTYIEEEDYYTYQGKFDITGLNKQFDEPIYKDYTERIREISEKEAIKTGDDAGMVRVNDEIVEIIMLFARLRANSVYYYPDFNGSELISFDSTLKDNEWLRYCWYYRQYDGTNK